MVRYLILPSNAGGAGGHVPPCTPFVTIFSLSLYLRSGTFSNDLFWYNLIRSFIRNLWNAEPIYKLIQYIEANPVRKKLAKKPEEWCLGSAYARVSKIGLLPDEFGLPVRVLDVKR
jgi:hypothetical protein